jgi:hypothetical protein
MNDEFLKKCREVPLVELADILFNERNPTLKRIAEMVLSDRLNESYRFISPPNKPKNCND